MFDWRVAHFPFYLRNVAYKKTEYGSQIVVGYTEMFLFGIRLARIQRTKPW